MISFRNVVLLHSKIEKYNIEFKYDKMSENLDPLKKIHNYQLKIAFL